MFTFISVPTDLVASVSTNSGAIFTDMLPVAYVVVGIALGLGLLSWTIGKFKGKRGRR